MPDPRDVAEAFGEEPADLADEPEVVTDDEIAEAVKDED